MMFSQSNVEDYIPSEKLIGTLAPAVIEYQSKINQLSLQAQSNYKNHFTKLKEDYGAEGGSKNVHDIPGEAEGEIGDVLNILDSEKT